MSANSELSIAVTFEIADLILWVRNFSKSLEVAENHLKRLEIFKDYSGRTKSGKAYRVVKKEVDERRALLLHYQVILAEEVANCDLDKKTLQQFIDDYITSPANTAFVQQEMQEFALTHPDFADLDTD